jgi:hypothetical protein
MLIREHPELRWRHHGVEELVDLLQRGARVVLTDRQKRRAGDLRNQLFETHLSDELVKLFLRFRPRKEREELLVPR